MAQNYVYPASSDVTLTGTPNGAPIPNTSILVAGENPAGNQEPLQTDSSGNLLVSIASEPLTPFNTKDAADGTLGAPAPTIGIQIAGNQTGNLAALTLDPSSNLNVNVQTSVLPTGAATSANQATELATLSAIEANQTNGTQVTQISGTVPISGTVTANQGTSPWVDNISQVGGSPIALGQAASAASLPVVIASDQSAVPISAVSLPLPTGAATSANQTNASQKTQLVDGSGNVIASTANALNVQVENFPATQPVSGTVAVTQSTSPWVDNISQFGGSNVVTGTGASGAGIPRVTVANDSKVELWDGTNTAAVKAASTPAAATDPALVVAISPNNGVAASTPTARTVTQAAITVGTSAVRLTVSGSAPSATRVTLVATPDTASTATFYIGSATVTNSGATRGAEITAGQSFIANNDAGDYYIVSSTAGQTVTVMEQA